ncbi:hypothetical protein [Parvicella tangerina]|uniref:Uncharacterized protein n=1 Tax=Parvicella tangerina TaxID=2829795 RepID=A0A916JND7_9FLAO|nr:hypothetical protein [Parvicella tangerina]CAG5083786.1 hypothetical protein CRYO30217_02288 [Parvicella tangerina]
MKTLYNTPIIEYFFKTLSALATGFFLSTFVKPYSPITFEVPGIVTLCILVAFALGFSYVTATNNIKHTVTRIKLTTVLIPPIISFGMVCLSPILYFFLPGFDDQDLFRFCLLFIPMSAYFMFLYKLFKYLKKHPEEAQEHDKYANVIANLTYTLAVYFGFFLNLG